MSENAVKFDLIEAYRERLDEIDEALVPLLEERLKIAAEIGKVKRERGLEIEDIKREKEVLEHIVNQVQNPDFKERVRSLFKEIIRVSKETQR
ncbi:MAG: chorismate mutase [Chlamydiia bacterium]|nr:chorismate mutase [Chlamydiia bacterium]